jgi:RND family efflux transporter MFP subunit
MVAMKSSARIAAGVVLTVVVAACGKLASGSDSTKVAQSGANPDSAPAPATPIALPVTVEAARDGDLVISIITSGQVRSENEARLKAEIGGTVHRVAVRPGQRVRRGQPLVFLDSTPFALALRQKQIEVERARIKFQYEYWAPDSLAGLRPGAEDRRKLFMTQSGLDMALIAHEQAKLDRDRATIVAPFDGVIDRVDVVQGERIGNGQAIATVVDIDHLRIEASVLQYDIPFVKEGGVATVATAASPNVLGRGQIVAVLAIVDSTTHTGRACSAPA